MSSFKVDTDALRTAAGRCDDISESIGNLARQLSDVKNDLNYDMGRYGGVMTAISNCVTNSFTCKYKVKGIGNSGIAIADMYTTAEGNIVSNIRPIAAWQARTGNTSDPNHDPTITPPTQNGPGQPQDPSNPVPPGGQTPQQNPPEDKENPLIKYLKKAGKAALDIAGGAGTYGKMAALPIALLKNVIDGDGISGKDIGSTLKGMANSVIGMCEEYGKTAGEFPVSSDTIKELAGLNAYKHLSNASTKAGWLAKLENAGTTFTNVLKDKFKPSGANVAAWSLALIANGFSNADEYNSKLGTAEEITKGRAVAETVSETLIDIGKGALVTAGVAAGIAAIGVSAPAVVVAGAAVAVSTVADIVCEQFTGKGVTEALSDAILDTAPKVAEAAVGAAKTVGKAVSGWFSKVGDSLFPAFAGG